METVQTRTRKSLYSELALARESKTQRTAAEWESLMVGKKKLSGTVCWHRDAVDRLSGKRVPSVIGQGGTFGFLQLVLDWSWSKN